MAASSLFDVYLRLRPAAGSIGERFLDIEEAGKEFPDHITIRPPENDRRKRAVEKFAFTRVFEEDTAQIDIFKGTGVLPLLEGVLGAEGREGRDGLLATLGVTGSGKSHTILGSKTQRGLVQMALDMLYQNLGDLLVDPTTSSSTFPSIAAADVSEAQMFPASLYLDSLYGDGASVTSRTQTPGLVCSPQASFSHPTSLSAQLCSSLYVFHSPSKIFSSVQPVTTGIPRVTRSTAAKIKSAYVQEGNSSFLSAPSRQRYIPLPSTLPSIPSTEDLVIDVDQTCEYTIVLSMYEVYNDRIFDLLTGAAQNLKSTANRRRALLFKPTEQSPDRKVVAGLRKIICGSTEEALMVLETGLIERKVTGTGSNAVSSRSHGFFCVEVKKRHKATRGPWSSSTLTVCDLAGSERARNAKTAGETLAEAGKINESLMYLGQCMQMQSDNHDGTKRNIVPFRQCKLTELLFSNSFPSHGHHHHNAHNRSPQKAIMIVTADPMGDYNATSQILRYSALAREVTVPRVPSITSTISTVPLPIHGHRPGTAASGRITPGSPPITAAADHLIKMEELDKAMAEVSRLNESLEILQLQLREEQARRQAAEASWRASEENMLAMEQEIRDELFAEFEGRIEKLQRQYKASWDEEADKNDERLDKKIELLTKGIQIYEDLEDKEDLDGEDERVRELEDENEMLRRKVEMLEKDLQTKSPTKKQRVLKAKRWGIENDPITINSP